MSKTATPRKARSAKGAYLRKTVVIPVELWNGYISPRLKQDPDGVNFSRFFRNLCREAMETNGQEEAC